MDIGSIFVIIALVVLVALYVSRPLFERQSPDVHPNDDQPDREHSTLMAEHDRILNALQELDFDQVLGKIPEEDYPQQRTALLLQGADVLRKLDALQPDIEQGTTEERIEAAIAARRLDAARYAAETASAVQGGNGRTSRRASSAVATPDDDLEIMLANRRRDRQEKSAGFCPKCGNPVQKSDRFCPKCGTKTA